MGIIDGIKGIFGKKENVPEEAPRRLQARAPDEAAGDEFVPRWKLAKKERELRAMDEPIIKRKRL